MVREGNESGRERKGGGSLCDGGGDAKVGRKACDEGEIRKRRSGGECVKEEKRQKDNRK